eukprot:11544482-Ditylum_brightwellii.AAC.1
MALMVAQGSNLFANHPVHSAISSRRASELALNCSSQFFSSMASVPPALLAPCSRPTTTATSSPNTSTGITSRASS